MAKATAKKIENNLELATEVLDLNDRVNGLSVDLKEAKSSLKEKTEELSGESRKIFLNDLGELQEDKTPEIYGNHEYVVGQRLINVNYKMSKGGFSMREIAGQPAYEVLPKVLGDENYKKLFTEITVLEDALDQSKLKQAANYRPDLVDSSLNPSALPDTVIEDLRDKYPDAFSYYVTDEEKYIKEVTTAETHTEVVTGTGFIGKVAKLPDDMRYKARKLFRKIFSDALDSAVKLGNKAQA